MSENPYTLLPLKVASDQTGLSTIVLRARLIDESDFDVEGYAQGEHLAIYRYCIERLKTEKPHQIP